MIRTLLSFVLNHFLHVSLSLEALTFPFLGGGFEASNIGGESAGGSMGGSAGLSGTAGTGRGSAGMITGGGGGAAGGSFEGGGGNGMIRMFVIRHKASGMCLYPKDDGDSNKDIEMVLDEKCNDPKAVFKWSKKRSIKSVHFSGYYLFVSEGNLVLHKSELKSSQIFSFNQDTMALQQNGRHVQPQGKNVAAGIMLVAKKGKFISKWMAFEILGKEQSELFVQNLLKYLRLLENSFYSLYHCGGRSI